MATKTATENGEERPAPIKRQEPGAVQNISGNVVGLWQKFTGFLSDVRAEMRKVVTPTRKEVQATTSVVIVTVFLFGFFFLVTDCDLRLGLAGDTSPSWAACNNAVQPRIENNDGRRSEQPTERTAAGAQRALQVVHPPRLLGL